MTSARAPRGVAAQPAGRRVSGEHAEPVPAGGIEGGVLVEPARAGLVREPEGEDVLGAAVLGHGAGETEAALPPAAAWGAPKPGAAARNAVTSSPQSDGSLTAAWPSSW